MIPKLNPDNYEESPNVYHPPDDDPDEFACLDFNDCSDPGGHVWLKQSGSERCIYCKTNPNE